nr:PREDICTED: nucleoplasmin-2 [Latimeria chalumnae]XP_014341926.1 PREDICTED: nucleoplasmin-2 [Latimeria chalumnae]|eukprot:XP_014341925.1 PREDICTED: nucleoplasmin-2 [Latimeria chalumnae]
MTSLASNTSKTDKPTSLSWGCELNAEKKAYTFEVPEDRYDHQLALKTICLGADAKDEFNVVELVPREEEDPNAKPLPIATLKASVMPMANMFGIEFHPPVTFQLRTGSGPVYMSGQHVILLEDYTWDEEEEEEEEEEEGSESPPKQMKRSASNKKAGPAKRKKEEPEETTEDTSQAKKVKAAAGGKKAAK